MAIIKKTIKMEIKPSSSQKETVMFSIRFSNETHKHATILDMNGGVIWSFISKSHLPNWLFKGDGNVDNFYASTHFLDENFTIENITKHINNSYNLSERFTKQYCFSGMATEWIIYGGHVEIAQDKILIPLS